MTVCAPWLPAPVIRLLLDNVEALVTQVAHAMVPDAVIGPPVRGEVVAILVTVPDVGAPPSTSDQLFALFENSARWPEVGGAATLKPAKNSSAPFAQPCQFRLVES